MKAKIDIEDFVDIDSELIANAFIKSHTDVADFDEYMDALHQLMSELYQRIDVIEMAVAVMDENKIDYNKKQAEEKLEYLNIPLHNIESIYNRLNEYKYEENWLYVKTNSSYDNLVMKSDDELDAFINNESFVALEGYRVKVEAWLNGIKNDKIALESGMKVVGQFGYDINANDSKMMMKKADLYIKRATEYYKKLYDGITARQDKCEHNWVEIGHDSHYSYYRCSICGKEERA